MKEKIKNDVQLVIYQAKNGEIKLRSDVENETIWATQAEMAQIFGVNPQAITKHIKNIYQDNELSQKATRSKKEQVRKEGNRWVKRKLEFYNLDVLIAVGYRINSVVGTKFRQWVTKTLRQHITEGYTINSQRIKQNYIKFLQVVNDIKLLLPKSGRVETEDVLDLVRLFADTWFSLEAYDKDNLAKSGDTKRQIKLTVLELRDSLYEFKDQLFKKGQTADIFGVEKEKGSVAGIVGNIMQSFGGKSVYPTVEEKAANLLYFIIKNHPFIDGNKRIGAFIFVWFLRKEGLLNREEITPATLTALTLFIAESEPKNKEKMIRLVLQLINK